MFASDAWTNPVFMLICLWILVVLALKSPTVRAGLGALIKKKFGG